MMAHAGHAAAAAVCGLKHWLSRVMAACWWLHYDCCCLWTETGSAESGLLAGGCILLAAACGLDLAQHSQGCLLVAASRWVLLVGWAWGRRAAEHDWWHM